jgi:transcriptional regulator with XRE-family HTH domain
VAAAVDISERFAANLATERKAVGLSQEELAGALDVPPARLLDGISWEPTATQVGRFKVE